jgi:cytochrome c oxidase cbb3-type subunit 3
MYNPIKKFFENLLYVAFVVFFETGITYAQAGNSDFPENYYDKIALFIVFVLVLIVWAFLYFGQGEGKPRTVKQNTALSKVRQFLTRSVPIEKEADIMFEHSFDGIKELDSRIPPWFSYLFYITIIFSVYYMLDYHVFNTGKLSAAEYDEEIKFAELKKAELIKSGTFINEDNVTALTDAASLESGKTIFTTNCIACHAADGGGIVGPNLTDNYWIHGGGIKNVFKVIKYGVVNKGMIAWQQQLNPKQMQEVASYVLTFQGTKPSNPKPPEGNPYKETQSTQ